MNKFLQTLGLAKQAGKLVTGEDKVVKGVRSGDAKLVILAVDAGINTEKKICDKCQTYEVPLIRMGDRTSLGKAIGKSQQVVVAIIDEGFSSLLLKSVK